jgi:mono/diheme cytochrome c family protein
MVKERSLMIEKKIWGLTLGALVTMGLSACGGDASANGETADPAPAQAVAAEADVGTDEAVADPEPQELPEGVTTAMIEEGEGIYNGAGICMSCHGADGSGIPNLGTDLTDEEWLHSDGTYTGIEESIAKGVTAQESSSGVPMPAKGGTAITDDQVAAVSAYVWSLSQ